MAIDAINASLNTTATTAAATATTKKNTDSALNMDDFLKLMVAQLQNQDMNNAADSSQFTAQMAQFSMVQALTDMSKQAQTSYGVSLIGKEVTVKNESNNTVVTGTVDSVNFLNGETQILVDGNPYATSSVIQVTEKKA